MELYKVVNSIFTSYTYILPVGEKERGKSARRLLSGDVVEIAPNIEHWHGASPDSWFSHIAVECNPQTNKNTWLEPVSDEEYGKAVNDK